jgi:hypothetical protein
MVDGRVEVEHALDELFRKGLIRSFDDEGEEKFCVRPEGRALVVNIIRKEKAVSEKVALEGSDSDQKHQTARKSLG